MSVILVTLPLFPFALKISTKKSKWQCFISNQQLPTRLFRVQYLFYNVLDIYFTMFWRNTTGRLNSPSVVSFSEYQVFFNESMPESTCMSMPTHLRSQWKLWIQGHSNQINFAAKGDLQTIMLIFVLFHRAVLNNLWKHCTNDVNKTETNDPHTIALCFQMTASPTGSESQAYCHPISSQKDKDCEQLIDILIKN